MAPKAAPSPAGKISASSSGDCSPLCVRGGQLRAVETSSRVEGDAARTNTGHSGPPRARALYGPAGSHNNEPTRPRCCESSRKRRPSELAASTGTARVGPSRISENSERDAVLNCSVRPAAAAAAAVVAAEGGGRRGDGAAEQGAVQEGGVRHPGLPLQEHVRLQEVGTPSPQPEESDCFVSPRMVIDLLVHMNWWRRVVFGLISCALFRS
jgi:hypothetical protein